MSDGTTSKAWQKFLAELNKEDVDFGTIQHADEGTRTQLLQSMTCLSSIDRAQVSSTWAKQAGAAGKGFSESTDSTPSNSQQPPVPIREANRNTQQEMSVPFRNPSMYDSAEKLQGSNSKNSFSGASFGRQEPSTYIPPTVNEYTPNGNSRSFGGNQALSTTRGGSQQQQPPVLAVPIMNLGLHGGDMLSLLRTALDRGDCGTALPLASEMLQTDPNSLIYLLNEFLPQLSVDQLKTILGVGAPLGSDSSPQEKSPRGASKSQPQQQQQVQTFFNSDNSMYNSPMVEMTTQPTINGQPLNAGQVLTAHSIQAQFGPRCTATCNGTTLKFPYCVQRGDKIVVRSANTDARQDRLL